MFKRKEILKTADGTIAEILKDKDLYLTEINHLINAAATVITEEVNGTRCYKSETHSPKTPPWVRCTNESINGVRKDLSDLALIKRDEMKNKNMKRNRLPRKNNMKEEKNLDQVTEELKQKVSAKAQQFSRHKKRQNQYYQNKIFRTDSKKFYNPLRKKNTNVKNAPTEEEIQKFWKEIFGIKFPHNEEA